MLKQILFESVVAQPPLGAIAEGQFTASCRPFWSRWLKRTIAREPSCKMYLIVILRYLLDRVSRMGQAVLCLAEVRRVEIRRSAGQVILSQRCLPSVTGRAVRCFTRLASVLPFCGWMRWSHVGRGICEGLLACALRVKAWAESACNFKHDPWRPASPHTGLESNGHGWVNRVFTDTSFVTRVFANRAPARQAVAIAPRLQVPDSRLFDRPSAWDHNPWA